jgi:hypothetical protein
MKVMMYFFPVVFMIHEFEEIIMLRPWLVKNQPQLLKATTPNLLKRLLQMHLKLSTEAFTLIVAEEFLLVSGITIYCINYDQYSIWIGLLLAFQLHLFMHMLQFVVLKRYVPSIVTSLLGTAYFVYTFSHIAIAVNWNDIICYAFWFLTSLVLNLFICSLLAIRFQAYLNRFQNNNKLK